MSDPLPGGGYQPYHGPPPTGSYIPPMQYPPGWGPHGYPYPFPAYGVAVDRKPGQVTAAAVLGYVVAGFLFLGALFLFFGASFLTDWDDISGQTHDSFVVQFVVCGLVNLAAGGVLIGGGVGLGSRSLNARAGYTVAALVVVIEAIYWMVAWGARSDGGAFVYAVLFGVPTLIGVWLLWSRPAMQWLDAPATSPTTHSTTQPTTRGNWNR